MFDFGILPDPAERRSDVELGNWEIEVDNTRYHFTDNWEILFLRLRLRIGKLGNFF